MCTTQRLGFCNEADPANSGIFTRWQMDAQAVQTTSHIMPTVRMRIFQRTEHAQCQDNAHAEMQRRAQGAASCHMAPGTGSACTPVDVCKLENSLGVVCQAVGPDVQRCSALELSWFGYRLGPLPLVPACMVRAASANDRAPKEGLLLSCTLSTPTKQHARFATGVPPKAVNAPRPCLLPCSSRKSALDKASRPGRVLEFSHTAVAPNAIVKMMCATQMRSRA